RGWRRHRSVRGSFETGRMALTLYHGLNALRLPVICIESRQAYQALKSLGTHKTDRNDARGLAHLGRTGFFKPVHVKSLSAHAVRSRRKRRRANDLARVISGFWVRYPVRRGPPIAPDAEN